ncbi:hypothetical protein B0H13DRAFT_2271767 [Mycena leptocephala]|nr:hypothetical protein B0H13DRAFT_2271767 [Mycena leptocephala]
MKRKRLSVASNSVAYLVALEAQSRGVELGAFLPGVSLRLHAARIYSMGRVTRWYLNSPSFMHVVLEGVKLAFRLFFPAVPIERLTAEIINSSLPNKHVFSIMSTEPNEDSSEASCSKGLGTIQGPLLV